MAARNAQLQLPLMLAGVSGRVADWLTQAGIPVTAWSPEAAARPRSPLALVTGKDAPFPPGRFVLYHSGRSAQKPDTQLCQRYGITRVDIAPLIYDAPTGAAAGPFANPTLSTIITNHGPDNPARSTFLDRLKNVIERNNGLWARIADYPFPYRCVLCIDGEIPGSEPIPLTIPRSQALGDHSGAKLSERITRRYRAGLPMMLETSAVYDESDVWETPNIGSYPFMWQTDQREFSRWWRHRSRIQLRVVQNAGHYRIHAENLPDDFTAAIELWRGGHVASVPLDASSKKVRLDGLVFEQQSKRHPAGFTSWWPDGVQSFTPGKSPVAALAATDSTTSKTHPAA